MSDKNIRNEKMEAIVSLAKRRGFVYQGSEIYGGLSGTWDYGPLGVALKRNLMNLWWKMFVEDRDDMYGVDAAILMNQKVWKASGHVNTFSDPLVWDSVTEQAFRADHLLKDNGIDTASMNLIQIDAAIKSNNIKSPNGNDLTDVQSFNMMFSTIVGPKYAKFESEEYKSLSGEMCFHTKNNENTKVSIKERHDINSFSLYDNKSISYLRPETAQGIFTNYKNVVDCFYPDLPFGIAQQGKAFRNEISPRDFVFRSREFEQMEIEYFVHPEKWQESFDMIREMVWEWCDAIGLPRESVHELEIPAEDLAHYSKRTIDFEFDFPIGREELLGLAYRTDFDLGNIQREAGKNMEYTVKGTNEKFVPHVIEPSFGVERAIMAVLSTAYTEDEIGGEKRVFLKLPEHLAPIRYAVSPLLKNKPELVKKARQVFEMMKKKYGAVMWDDNGNIGKRYRRQDEIGTPYCVVIDFETLENDTVTVRDRDTTEQKRVSIEELVK